MKSWLLIWGALLLATELPAQRYEAEGWARIEQGDVARARQMAVDMALQQAMQQREAVLNSEQQWVNGELSSSLTRVRSQAQARNLKVVREQIQDQQIQVWIETELTAAGQCQRASHHYRQTLAVLNFPVNSTNTADYAPVDNAARILPGRLAESLLAAAQVLPASHLRLYGDTQNAPGLVTDTGALTSVIQLGEQLKTQFILAGVVHNLAMRHPGQARAGNWFNRSRDRLGLGESERYWRDAELQIFLYEAFSGRLIFQQRYQATADWPFAQNQQPALGSQAFWQSPYGQALSGQLKQAGQDISEQLACQPFMIKIDKVEQRELYIRQGALAGIARGDRFEVRQLRRLNSRDGSLQQLLSPSRATATVIQVQPDLTQLQLSNEAAKANIQIDDVLVSW